MAPAKKASKAPPTGKKANSPKRQTSKSQPDPQTSKRSTRATRRASTRPSPDSDNNSRGRESVSLSPPAPTKGPRPTAKRTRIRNEDEGDSPSRLQDITEAVNRASNANVVDRAAELREMKQARLLKKAIRDNRRLREQLQESQRVAKGLEIERNFRSVDRPSERKRNNPYEVAPLRQVLGLEVLASDPDVLKELKNETYNYLREVARYTVGDQELERKIVHGAHWDGLDVPQQVALREDFIKRIDKGGALMLTFYHSVAALDVKRFTLDWPVNELLKTVLRDQRVQMLNAKSKVFYGNALYNELLEHHATRFQFPSAPVVRHLKTVKQGKIGRPRKDAEKQRALAITPGSRKNLKELEKTLRVNYRALSRTPEFNFEDTGGIIMPVHRPMVKRARQQIEADSAHASEPDDPGSPSAPSANLAQEVFGSRPVQGDMGKAAERNASRRRRFDDDGVNLDNSEVSSEDSGPEYGNADEEDNEDEEYGGSASSSTDSSDSDSDSSD